MSPVIPGLPIDTRDVLKDMDLYDGRPEGYDVFSWSPEPASTPNAKVTQVHLHQPVAGLGRIVTRFKGPGTLDRLIDALIEHREHVWGKR